MTADPVALALLRRLAELRPPDDPLHEFASTVLAGEATLRAAADHPAFGEAFIQALREHAPPEPPPADQVAALAAHLRRPPPGS